MALGERSRHEMYLKFEEVLGAQVANTLMEHLPPVGWADVATKRDLDAQITLVRSDLDAQISLVRTDLDAQISLVRSDLDAQSMRLELFVRSEIRGEINRLMLWLFPTILTSMGLAFGAAKLS